MIFLAISNKSKKFYGTKNWQKNLACKKEHVEIIRMILSIRDMVVERCPHKSLLQWICRKCLSWKHGHDHFWSLRLWRLIVVKNIIYRRTLWHFNSTFGSSLSASSAYQRFTKKCDQLWLAASMPRILEPSPQGLISSTYIFSNILSDTPAQFTIIFQPDHSSDHVYFPKHKFTFISYTSKVQCSCLFPIPVQC